MGIYIVNWVYPDAEDSIWVYVLVELILWVQDFTVEELDFLNLV